MSGAIADAAGARKPVCDLILESPSFFSIVNRHFNTFPPYNRYANSSLGRAAEPSCSRGQPYFIYQEPPIENYI
jgi:hypothetical protein